MMGRLKSWLRRTGHGTTERPVLRWTFEKTVAAELAIARAFASRRPPAPPVDPGNLTLLIKTFERPAVLRRMLASVRQVFAGPIIVADDSSKPLALNETDVEVIPLPFDSGVGAGRNALIDAARTEYLWMADDDMILLPNFDVTKPIDYLTRHPAVDLYGGRVINLPHFQSPDYTTARLYAYARPPRAEQGTLIGGLPVLYKVPNFYVARTERVRSVRYDDQLKRIDHNDFFTAAYGELLCVYDSAWCCLHAHSFFDSKYQAFRTDVRADAAYLSLKYDRERKRPPR